MQHSALLAIAVLFVFCEARPPWRDQDAVEQKHGFTWDGSRHPMDQTFPPLKENPTIYRGNRIIMFIGEGTWRCNYQRVLLELMENPSEMQQVVDRCFVPSPSNSSSGEVDDPGDDNSAITESEGEDDNHFTVDNGHSQTETHGAVTEGSREESTHENIDIASSTDLAQSASTGGGDGTADDGSVTSEEENEENHSEETTHDESSESTNIVSSSSHTGNESTTPTA